MLPASLNAQVIFPSRPTGSLFHCCLSIQLWLCFCKTEIKSKIAQNDEGMKLFCHHWSRVWACDKRFLHHFSPAHSANSSFFFRLVLFTGRCLNIYCLQQTSYGNIRLYKVHPWWIPWSSCASTAPRVTTNHKGYSQNRSGTNIYRNLSFEELIFWSTAINVSTLWKCSDITHLFKYQYKSQAICDKVKLSLLLKIDLFDYSMTHLYCS